ncbi:2780_t:CDS:2, partial [Ambispora leptoticha]
MPSVRTEIETSDKMVVDDTNSLTDSPKKRKSKNTEKSLKKGKKEKERPGENKTIKENSSSNSVKSKEKKSKDEVQSLKEISTENNEQKSKKFKDVTKRKTATSINDSGSGDESQNSVEKPKKKRKIENGTRSESPTSQDSVMIESINNEKETEEAEVPENLRFSSYRLSQITIESLKKRGVTALFPIQAATFDYIFDGKDVLARAKTGTGKTLAFALPITERLINSSDFAQLRNRRGRAPQVVVMTPTRDLAKQVATEFGSIASSLAVSCIYGGVPYAEQYRELRDGIDVLVGTPGRVMDHIDRDNLNLADIKFICLDEADQMLDIGFAEAMEKVLQHVKEHKEKKGKGVDYQTMLFSATVPDWVKETVKKYLKEDYVNIDLIGKMDNKTNENICHYAIRSAWHSRKDIIGDVVATYGGSGSCVIFCNTKNDANELVLNDKLKQDAQVLHGDIAQSQREVTMKGFREGKFKCIICTDVLARGIDIPQVDLVINCEPPKDVETYVHRSGRTGRAGRPGTAVTFFKSQEEYLINNIQRKTRIQFSIVGPPQPVDIVAATAQDAVQNLESVNPSILPYFHATAKLLIDNKGAIEALSAALAYMTGYSNGIKTRSLLSGNEGCITLLFRFSYPVRHVSYARNILERSFPNLKSDQVKLMRLTKDGLGIAMDILSEKVEIGIGEEEGDLILAGTKWQNTKSTTLE